MHFSVPPGLQNEECEWVDAVPTRSPDEFGLADAREEIFRLKQTFAIPSAQLAMRRNQPGIPWSLGGGWSAPSYSSSFTHPPPEDALLRGQ